MTLQLHPPHLTRKLADAHTGHCVVDREFIGNDVGKSRFPGYFIFPQIWIFGHAETVPRHISRFQFRHFEKSTILIYPYINI